MKFTVDINISKSDLKEIESRAVSEGMTVPILLKSLLQGAVVELVEYGDDFQLT